ncbi:MAG: hypothetical protein IKR78_03035 [Dehalococcoidales bacterium]|nr:hypothetical protein [Dehalococcoidales bacterium]
MKKFIAVLLAVVCIIACLGLGACAGTKLSGKYGNALAYFQFSEDGTVSSNLAFGLVKFDEGTYKVSGKTITIKYKNSENSTTTITMDYDAKADIITYDGTQYPKFA